MAPRLGRPAGKSFETGIKDLAISDDAVDGDTKRRAMGQFLRKLREEAVAKAEYVGPRFAQEARRIEDKEAPARGIYGEATLDEARALIDEGISFMPLPVLPDDLN